MCVKTPSGPFVFAGKVIFCVQILFSRNHFKEEQISFLEPSFQSEYRCLPFKNILEVGRA
jgi:hypothetical protein